MSCQSSETDSAPSKKNQDPQGQPGSSSSKEDKDTQSSTQDTPDKTSDESLDATSGASKHPEEIPDGPRKLGLPCDTAKDCKSEICAEVPAPRKGKDATELRCSECTEDTQCTETEPNTFCTVDRKKRARVCADGSDGDLCKEDEQCQSKICTLVNLGDNETELKSCASCRTHDDCSEDAPNCISRPDDRWKPFNQCLPDGVRKNGEVCFPCETGDRECEGLCVSVETKGPMCLGVCGECAIDSDCETGFVCQAPKLTPGKGGMHQASKCVKKGG